MCELLELIAGEVTVSVEHSVDEAPTLRSEPRGVRVGDVAPVDPIEMLVEAGDTRHDWAMRPCLYLLIEQGLSRVG